MTFDYHEPSDDEIFTESAVVDEVKNLVENDFSWSDAKVTVSGEYDRKGYTTRSSLYPLGAYQNDGDDIVVTVEFRISGWDNKQDKLVQVATEALKEREQKAIKAQELAHLAKIAQLEAELAALRK
jgi:hypothetical protein